MQSTLERLQRRHAELGEGEGGFTLIELLIVIVILGILAAIVVFAVQNLSGQSSVAACQAQYKTIETALESYKAEIGTYPSSWGDLTTTKTSSLVSGTLGPWLKDTPPTGTGVKDTYSFDSNGNVLINGSTGGTTNCQ
jgi:general secretion pathway protein G